MFRLRFILLLLFVTLLAAGACAQKDAPTGFIVKGATLVPLRYIAEWLGAKVEFDAATSCITMHVEDKTISLTLGSKDALIDGTSVQLTAPAMERKGVTYVPLRFVAEAFQAEVYWHAVARQVTVIHPDSRETLVVDVVASGKPAKAVKPPSQTALLSSLKQEASVKGAVQYAAIQSYGGRYFGIVGVINEDEGSDACPAYAILYRYDLTAQQWIENDQHQGEELPKSLLVDSEKASQAWGVPQNILDSWLEKANAALN